MKELKELALPHLQYPTGCSLFVHRSAYAGYMIMAVTLSNCHMIIILCCLVTFVACYNYICTNEAQSMNVQTACIPNN